MKKIIDIFLTILIYVCAFFTLLFGWVFYERNKLDYVGGRHFDSVNSVIYDAGGVLVYGLIFLVFLLVGIAVFIIKRFRS